MINKFQQGGKQLEALMLFVQGLAQTLKADPKLIIQIVQLNPKALEAAVQTYQQTQDMNQAAQAFQSQIQSAKHGAKLQYIKSLKHQCADDEEVVYYKKGGSVGCGCRKKLETGGKTEQSPIEKFKAIRKAQLGDTLAKVADATGSLGGFKKAQLKKKKEEQPKKEEYWDKHGNYIISKKKMNERQKLFDSNKTKEETTPPKINKGIGKNENGAKLKNGICPKCGKVHAAGTGCSIVAKFKKHRLGGSLNRIPFIKKVL